MVLTKFLMSNGSKKEEVETLCCKVGADVVFDDESIDVITKSIENVVNASLNPETVVNSRVDYVWSESGEIKTPKSQWTRSFRRRTKAKTSSTQNSASGQNAAASAPHVIRGNAGALFFVSVMHIYCSSKQNTYVKIDKQVDYFHIL